MNLSTLSLRILALLLLQSMSTLSLHSCTRSLRGYTPHWVQTINQQLHRIFYDDDIEAFQALCVDPKTPLSLNFNPTEPYLSAKKFGFAECPLARSALKYDAGNILEYILAHADESLFQGVSKVEVAYARRHHCHSVLRVLSLHAPPKVHHLK